MSNTADSVLAAMASSEFTVDATSPAVGFNTEAGIQHLEDQNHPDRHKEDDKEVSIDLEGVEFEHNGEKIVFEKEAHDSNETDSTDESKSTTTPDDADSNEPTDGLSEAMGAASEIAEGLTDDPKLVAAGIDMDAVMDEFRETGKVSQETLDKAKEAGYSDKAIKSVLRGAVAAAAEVERQFFGKFGGKESYMEMIQWASSNGDAETVSAFNACIDRGDMSTAAALGKALQSAQKASTVARRGTANKQIMGSSTGGTTSSGVKGFASLDEMAGAMGDSRYMKDPQYTAMVRQRAAAMDYNPVH